MNRTVLVFLLGALAAGGALGYVVGSSVGSGGEITFDDETSGNFDHRPAAPRPVEGDPGAAGGGRYQSLGHALSGISVSRSKRGNGTITGTVLTEDGDPLPGVVVRAAIRSKSSSRSRYKRGSGPPEDKDLEEYVRERVKSYLEGLDSRREAMTDAEGNYTIGGISEEADDKYYLVAWCRAYELRQNPSVREIRAGSTVNFKAKSIHTIPCHVYLPDGTMPEKASVRAYRGNGSRSYTWYKDAPEIQLDPGDYQLQATGGEDNIFRSEKLSVSVAKGQVPAGVELRLKDEPGVRGTVVFPPGEQNLSVQIGLLKLEDGADTSPDRLLREGNKNYVRGSHAKFVFRDLAPGTYLVGLIFNNSVVMEHETVVVQKVMEVVTFTLPAPEASQYVLLTITTPGGKRATDVSFRAGYRAENHSRSGSSRTQQMPDGVWRVFHYPIKKEDEKPGGLHSITVTSRKYGSRTVEYNAANTQTLTVQFEEPATLTVTVAGYRGSGMEGKISLSVTRVPKDGKNRNSSFYGSRKTGLDSEGTQKFGPLSPGEYDIAVRVKQDRYRWTTAHTVTTVLKAGENVETVTVPKLHSLTVIVDTGQDGTSFRLTSRSQSGSWYSSNNKKATDGRVVFENLVAGDYTLQAWGKAQGQMKLSIPSQTTVRFEPMVFNAYKVRVRDANGTFVKAGLLEGDLLIGIDGEEFTNERTMGAMMTLAMERKNVSLLILRGGRRLTVAVDFSNAYNQKVAGIWWEKTSR